MTLIRALAILLGALLLAVVAMDVMPGLRDGLGNPSAPPAPARGYDNLLYIFTSVWALGAGLMSHSAALLCFRLSGAVYAASGALGVIAGTGCFDGSFLVNGFRPFNDIEFPQRLFASTPHLAIGAIALSIGFWLAAHGAAPAATPHETPFSS